MNKEKIMTDESQMNYGDALKLLIGGVEVMCQPYKKTEVPFRMVFEKGILCKWEIDRWEEYPKTQSEMRYVLDDCWFFVVKEDWVTPDNFDFLEDETTEKIEFTADNGHEWLGVKVYDDRFLHSDTSNPLITVLETFDPKNWRYTFDAKRKIS